MRTTKSLKENFKFNAVKTDTNQSLVDYKAAYEKEIKELTQKYEEFIDSSLKKQEDIHKTILDDQ